MTIEKIKEIYHEIEALILERFRTFQSIHESRSNLLYFEELAFCICTPQSKPRMAERAIALLKEKGILFHCPQERVGEMRDILALVRFKNRKSDFLRKAQSLYAEGDALLHLLESETSIYQKRELIHKSVSGIGLKEASHFLRNTGYGLDLAILDRHILRTMCELKLIDKVPSSISYERYSYLEKILQDFAKSAGISMFALDFVLFYNKTGEIFK